MTMRISRLQALKGKQLRWEICQIKEKNSPTGTAEPLRSPLENVEFENLWSFLFCSLLSKRECMQSLRAQSTHAGGEKGVLTILQRFFFRIAGSQTENSVSKANNITIQSLKRNNNIMGLNYEWSYRKMWTGSTRMWLQNQGDFSL